MAKSFIQIGDHGFWAQDRFIEAMQLCLIQEIEEQNLDSTPWVIDYKEALALESVPMSLGERSMRLETFITDSDRACLALQMIDAVIEKIDANDQYFTAQNLHAFRKRALEILAERKVLQFASEEKFNTVLEASKWHKSPGITAVKKRYQHAFILLRRLINQELQSTVTSPVNYWVY